MATRSGTALPALSPARDCAPLPATIQRFRVTVLQWRITTLERELDAERERRQAVVDRYERLLAER